jgi:hypothetical protein
VTFDREIIEARLTLDLIGSSDMPKIAWDALEAGLDGRYIRRLAALDSPTYFEVRDVLPQAMEEMRIVKISRDEAALRIAKRLAQEIMDGGKDPLKHTRELEWLWIKAGYPRAIQSVGNLDDDIYLAQSSQSDDQIREWVTLRLKELVTKQEPA